MINVSGILDKAKYIASKDLPEYLCIQKEWFPIMDVDVLVKYR